MKHNKKGSGKISRRNFANAVATSVIAAPLTSAQSQVKIRTMHIPPPIEIFPGSVILETDDDISAPNDTSGNPHPRKQKFEKDKQITSVRVITYKDDITEMKDVEYTSATPPGRRRIEIWVKTPIIENKPNMVFRTVGASGHLHVEIDNTSDKFDTLTPGGGTHTHPRKRWKYSESITTLLKVRLTKPDGRTDDVTAEGGKKIVLIQIKTEKDVSP